MLSFTVFNGVVHGDFVLKKIAVVSATRAEYGLLSPVIKELRKNENESLQIQLLVTGTHLSDQFGRTVREIDDRIDQIVPVSVKSDSEQDISNNQAEILCKFTNCFLKDNYDAVMLLGDRYEMLSIAIAAGNTRTPVFHLCGGDTTEGAIDEWIRHSITKIGYLHFVTNEESRRRVIQLGENPERVFNYGSTSIDNVIKIANVKKDEILSVLGLPNCKYAVCTYHPVTMDGGNEDEQVYNLLNAIYMFPEMEFIVTKSNADKGGARINRLMEEAASRTNNIHMFSSLGAKRYLSLIKHSEFVLGNSSSGIIEAPALHTPTVNIGDRQKGRLKSKSIINCDQSADSIINAMKKALSEEHRKICKMIISPYGDGHAAERIAKKAIELVMSDSINIKKSFYNIRFDWS